METFSLSSDPIDAGVLELAMADPAAGALVTFHGRVRNHDQGRPVLALEYHAQEALAEKEGQSVIDDLHRGHPACRIVARHRLGKLEIGEIALWVGVTSAHRAEAFAACEACVVAIKSRLPIWKKEFYADQTTNWLEQTVLPDGKAHDTL